MTAPISGVARWGVKAWGGGRPDIAVRTPNPTRDGPEWGRFGEFCVPTPLGGAALLDTRAGGFYIASFALRP